MDSNFNIRNKLHNFIENSFFRQPITGPVLEVGSGRDRFNRKLFSRKFKVISANIYPQNVVDHIASVNCLPFKDGEFGCVICEHVLEHVEEPSRAIEEMKRVLKPKGLLILIVPFSWPIHEKPYDLWRFTEEGLRYLLMTRFDRVAFESIGNPHNPPLICVTARKPTNKRTAGKTKCPKVSVIMSTCNRAHMIGRSIESILNQTFKDWELIIVSDGSTDNTREVVLSYHDPRIRYFHKEHGGLASGRNYGIRQAKGEYVAYSDDDDIMLPFHLKTLANYLDRHPEVGFVKGDYANIKAKSQKGYLFAGSLLAAMHSRDAYKKIGFFNEEVQLEMTDMILRLQDYCTTKKLDIIFVHRYLHKSNLLKREPEKRRDEGDRMYAKRFPVVYKRHNPKREYLYFLGFFMVQMGFPKTTLKVAQIFHRLMTNTDNGRLKSNYFLGAGYYLSGDDSKAVLCLNKVIELGLASPQKLNADEYRILEFTYALLGRIYTLKREFERAQQYLCQGRTINPKSNIVSLLLSDCRQKTTVKKRASQYYLRKYGIEKKVNWLSPLITSNLIRNSSQRDADKISELLSDSLGDVKPQRRIL